MKRSLNQFVTSLLFLSIFLVSCKKDDPLHHISMLENKVLSEMNDYRTSVGLNALVLNHIMFKEARDLSDRLAANEISVHDNVIPVKLQELTSNFGGNASSWLVLESQYEIADSIMTQLRLDSSSNAIVINQFTQAGVGISSDDSGISHVCLLFLNIP